MFASTTSSPFSLARYTKESNALTEPAGTAVEKEEVGLQEPSMPGQTQTQSIYLALPLFSPRGDNMRKGVYIKNLSVY